MGENLNELSEKLESALGELKEKNTDLEKSIKLEQQLEQQQMAFFSAVSHELKTPITILKGQIQGMLLEVGGYKDRDRYLKRSFEVANSMENMVQEILYVSKIRTSGFELKLIDIPLHQLVENVIKEQEDMAIGADFISGAGNHGIYVLYPDFNVRAGRDKGLYGKSVE